MRFVHTSDLHLGRDLFRYSLEEDQKHILGEILRVAKESDADGIIVAGDVYDRRIPPEWAVALFDEFLTEASKVCPVYVVPGNHDSADRLGFGRSMMARSGVHVAGPYSGRMERIETSDEHGKLNIWLLPYFHPADAREKFKDVEIEDADEGLAETIRASGVDPSERNILVAHQNVVGKGVADIRRDSESVRPSTGGADAISWEGLDAFDYVALGHLHTEHPAGRDGVRYSGTPMKYSVSEKDDVKCVLVVDVKGKGSVEVRKEPLHPLHDLKAVEGTLEDLIAAADLPEAPRDNYVHATVVGDGTRATERLREKYPLLLDVRFEGGGDFDMPEETDLGELRSRDPADLFAEFYENVNGEPMNESQRNTLEKACQEAAR